MTDRIFPPSARISSMQWTAIGNAAVARSIFTGAVRTVQRQGQRLRASLVISNANDKEPYPLKSSLRGLLYSLDGQENRIWFGDPAYVMRGSFPCAEMLTNTAFANGSTGWTLGAGWSLTVNDGVAKLTSTSATPSTPVLYQSVTLTTGISYVVRSMSLSGSGTTQPGAVLGSINNSSGAAGMYTAFGTAGSTGAQNVGVYHTTPGGFAIGRTFFVPWSSCQRCALVNGAAQTGGSLSINSLPISTAGLALPGDFVQIGTQLAIVRSSLDSDSSGAGTLIFKPILRASPAANSPVIFGFPIGRFVMTQNESGWNQTPGGFSDFSFEFEEALDL